MRLPFKKIFVLIVSLTVLFCVGFQVYRIYRSARQTLAETRARLDEKNRVAFEKKVLTPHLSNKIQIRQNTSDVRDLIRFKDSYFAATGGGLVRFDENGKTEKHFTVLDGLPESDLICLATFQNKLYIGTRTKSLVAFDGKQFENYVFTDRQTNAVAAILESNGRLLIGTFGGGLLEFDGAEFTEITAAEKRILAISYLYADGAKLFVGTFDNGLRINEAGVWSHFTTAENLPSNRVVGVAIKNGKTYVAADFGLAVLENKALRSLAVLPALSGLIRHENRILLTKDTGETFTFENSLSEFSRAEKITSNARLISRDGQNFLVSKNGAATIKGKQIKRFDYPENEFLTDNFVSALAFDRNENLWVGSFRNGIDVFGENGRKIKHLESESLREINFL